MVAPRHHEYYRERSHHFMELVDDVLARGELELACEILWGAAAHAIKSAAQRKQWRHDTHDMLRATVVRLIAETGAPPYLRGQYRLASDLHVGFYGDRVFDASHIRHAKEPIAEFIGALESLR